VTRVYVSTLIDATPSEVWQAVEPIERHVEWMTDAEAIRFEGDQRRGVGTRFVCDTKVGPLRLTDHMEVTEWDTPRTMGVRHAGVVTGTGRFTIEPAVQGGTLFAWEEDLRFPWYLGGPLAGAVGGGQVMRRIWRQNLATLKHLIEAQT
jgi:carbon monoxide dehydrogenase subunit G